MKLVRRLAVAALLTLLALTRDQPTGSQDGTDPDPARFASEIAAFAEWDRQNSAPAHAVLFAGSSSICMWPTADEFPSLPVINRGLGGAHISDVDHYVRQTVLCHAPDIVVFYAGDNDIADGKSSTRVRDDYRRFVEHVLAERASTQIIFVSIKPSLARWQLWPAMREANALVRAYTQSRSNLHYADVVPGMLGDDGQPRRELFLADGLHLSAAGYDLWREVVGRAIDTAQAHASK